MACPPALPQSGNERPHLAPSHLSLPSWPSPGSGPGKGLTHLRQMDRQGGCAFFAWACGSDVCRWPPCSGFIHGPALQVPTNVPRQSWGAGSRAASGFWPEGGSGTGGDVDGNLTNSRSGYDGALRVRRKASPWCRGGRGHRQAVALGHGCVPHARCSGLHFVGAQ